MEKHREMKLMQHRAVLQTCWASFTAIAHKSCKKVEEIDGPLGSIPKRGIALVDSFFPFVYIILNHWPTLLSFMDDQILTIENRLEIIFPPSKRLFDKIDGLLGRVQDLPVTINDEFFRKFLHRFPLLDWILVHLISSLSFLLSIKGSNHTGEKHTSFDLNCKSLSPSFEKCSNGRETMSEGTTFADIVKSSKPAIELESDSATCSSYSSSFSDNELQLRKTDATDCCSYREILERQTIGDDENEGNVVQELFERDKNDRNADCFSIFLGCIVGV